MATELPFQPLVFSAEELPGILEVPDCPEITAGYADIYHGVWKGEEGTQVDVAIKEFKQLVPKDKRTDLDALKRKTDKRIKREVAVWSRIHHPNLHPLLGYRSQPRPRLISPWCLHGNLKDYLQDNPDLSRLQKLRLVHQAGCGLHHLHTQTPPICHADIKPQNVLINDLLEAALSDFGLSRVLQELGEPGEFTTSETVKGTLNYMAGELFAGSKPNLQTDVYAFGGLVLNVMSGKAPFFGLQQTTIILRAMQNQPPTPEDHPDLPSSDPLWVLMRGCWDGNAAARPTIQVVLGKLLGHISYEQCNPWRLHGLRPFLEDGGSKYSDVDLEAPGVTLNGGLVAPPSLDPVPANIPLGILEAEEARDSISGAVFAARKVLRSLKMHSKVVPAIGKYFAAAVEVGLTLVEMVELGSKELSFTALSLESGCQAGDRDKYMPSSLAPSTRELAVLLELLYKISSSHQEGDISLCIMNIQRELRFVQEKIEKWRSSGSFLDAFSSFDRTEELWRCQEKGRKLLEEIQLLVNVNATDFATGFMNPAIRKQHRRLLELLGEGKYGAQGNTMEDVICFPETRVEVLKRIDNWIRDTSTPDRVLWIRGMAGQGKSTIVSTVIHNWKYRASCATFHFRRGQSTLNSSIVCLLARQLGTSLVPDVRNAVLNSVQENEDISHQRFDEQFKTLLVASLANLSNQTGPVLLAIDALDECDNTQDAVLLVKLIDQHSPSLPTNVKFLLTCRPEAPLLHILEPRKWRAEDLDSASNVSDDIARFIKQACIQIRDDHDLPAHWPSSEDVARLVEMSEGLFQWARTAMIYVGNGSPVDRLRGLLRRPSVWSGLDDLYHQILQKAFDHVKLDTVRQELLSSVMGALVVAPYPVSLEVIAALYGDNEMFDGMDQVDIIRFLRKDILADLNSLLLMPASPAECIRLMHASISDLLVSKQRCDRRPYYIDSVRHHQQLANLCLSMMVRHLKKNICNLSDLSKPNSEVQDVVERDISKAVRYCCRAWAVHLTEGVKWTSSSTSASAFVIGLADFNLFSKEKLMCWVEVMSLLGATREAVIMAKRVYQWLSRHSGEISELDPLLALWKDVQRFITTFSEPISFGALHIYASALPHCPAETELWKCYQSCATVRTVRGHQMQNWPPTLWTRSAGLEVQTVAFSPDGALLASGGAGRRIQLWDAETGTPSNVSFTAHDSSVSSVCFSPNGKVLASASWDLTIRLWDTQTWTAVCDPLTGHSSSVNSVCFSPSGKVLASGSYDKTIRLWDIQTGKAAGELLTGDSVGISSVCFSRDGKVMASGSDEGVIRLWDTRTWRTIDEPLEGHNKTLSSICFSPDGKVMASGSADGTIRLWDIQTRKTVGGPLVSSRGAVHSVCFSPDGKLLASGGGDFIARGAIQFWDTQTGRVIGVPLTDHRRRVYSVCFSPDGKVLASGSDDKTIRLWDAQAGVVIDESPPRHNEKIESICVSPNGKTVASESRDGTIQLWDSHTGRAIGNPLTGHSAEVSISFSPNSKVLASVSSDNTLRLWDSQTGEALSHNIHGVTNEAICFSPGGKILACVVNHNSIQYLDAKSGRPIGVPWRAHKDGNARVARAACFSPDGSILALGYTDHRIRLWDAQTGQAIGKPLSFGDIKGGFRAISFSPDGMHIMANFVNRSSTAWRRITLQQCDTPRSLPRHASLYMEHNWLKYASSHVFWLPAEYWMDPREMIIRSGTLAVHYNEDFSIFDVSCALTS